MRHYRKLSLLVASALLAIGLTACAKPAKPVTITYWHRMTGTWNDAQQKMINDFNKSQNKYRVKSVSVGSYETLENKITTADDKSKGHPVMAQAPYTNIGDYVRKGLIQPWDAEMLRGHNKLTAVQLSDIYLPFLHSGDYADKYYGVPYSASTRILFYNKAMLQKYKLVLPKTWDDVKANAQKLKGTGIAAMALDRSYDVELEGMAAQAGPKLIGSSQQANLTAPSTLAAVDTLLGLRKAGALTTAGEDDYFSVAMFNGKAAMGIGSSSSIPVLQQQAPEDMAWGTAPIPGGNGSNGSILNGNVNVLFNGITEEERAGAWAFQKFLLKPENVAYWAKKSGYVPVTKHAVKSKSYQAYLEKNPEYQAAVDASGKTYVSTIFAGYSDYRTELLKTVDQTLKDGADAHAAFNHLQQVTKQIMTNSR